MEFTFILLYNLRLPSLSSFCTHKTVNCFHNLILDCLGIQYYALHLCWFAPFSFVLFSTSSWILNCLASSSFFAVTLIFLFCVQPCNYMLGPHFFFFAIVRIDLVFLLLPIALSHKSILPSPVLVIPPLKISLKKQNSDVYFKCLQHAGLSPATHHTTLKITLTLIAPRLSLLHLHWFWSDKKLFLLAETCCSHDCGRSFSLQLSQARHEKMSMQDSQGRSKHLLNLCCVNSIILSSLMDGSFHYSFQ